MQETACLIYFFLHQTDMGEIQVNFVYNKE